MSFIIYFYDHKGGFCTLRNDASWIDLKTRKLTGLGAVFFKGFEDMEKAAGYRILTKEDTRKFAKTQQYLKG